MTFSAAFSLFWTEKEEDYFEAIAIDDFNSVFHLWGNAPFPAIIKLISPFWLYLYIVNPII